MIAPRGKEKEQPLVSVTGHEATTSSQYSRNGLDEFRNSVVRGHTCGEEKEGVRGKHGRWLFFVSSRGEQVGLDAGRPGVIKKEKALSCVSVPEPLHNSSPFTVCPSTPHTQCKWWLHVQAITEAALRARVPAEDCARSRPVLLRRKRRKISGHYQQCCTWWASLQTCCH